MTNSILKAINNSSHWRLMGITEDLCPANVGQCRGTLYELNCLALTMPDVECFARDLSGKVKDIPLGFPNGSAILIINEQHVLLPEQQKLLLNKFGSFYTIQVPANGWDIETMKEVATLLMERLAVFASPIPYLIREVSAASSYGNFTLSEGGNPRAPKFPLIFHNDRREKQELPSGKVIYTVAKEGWQLI